MPADSAPVQRDMNVTPMIDVLLVLLIIYMVANRDRYTHSVLAPEPEVSATSTGLQLVLELPAGGGFALNGQPIPDAELEVQLEAIYRGRVNRLLFVKPDPTRRYHEVIQAIDRAKMAGVQIVAFAPAPGEMAPR